MRPVYTAGHAHTRTDCIWSHTSLRRCKIKTLNRSSGLTLFGKFSVLWSPSHSRGVKFRIDLQGIEDGVRWKVGAHLNNIPRRAVVCRSCFAEMNYFWGGWIFQRPPYAEFGACHCTVIGSVTCSSLGLSNVSHVPKRTKTAAGSRTVYMLDKMSQILFTPLPWLAFIYSARRLKNIWNYL